MLSILKKSQRRSTRCSTKTPTTPAAGKNDKKKKKTISLSPKVSEALRENKKNEEINDEEEYSEFCKGLVDSEVFLSEDEQEKGNSKHNVSWTGNQTRLFDPLAEEKEASNKERNQRAAKRAAVATATSTSTSTATATATAKASTASVLAATKQEIYDKTVLSVSSCTSLYEWKAAVAKNGEKILEGRLQDGSKISLEGVPAFFPVKGEMVTVNGVKYI